VRGADPLLTGAFLLTSRGESVPENNRDLEPKTPGTNPKTGLGAEGIDPSAPNTGTSNWVEPQTNDK
jgi:hypothetical protein